MPWHFNLASILWLRIRYHLDYNALPAFAQCEKGAEAPSFDVGFVLFFRLRLQRAEDGLGVLGPVDSGADRGADVADTQEGLAVLDEGRGSNGMGHAPGQKRIFMYLLLKYVLLRDILCH